MFFGISCGLKELIIIILCFTRLDYVFETTSVIRIFLCFSLSPCCCDLLHESFHSLCSSSFSSIELITASVIQGLLMAFLIVDFGIADLHDSSIALVKVSKNMLNLAVPCYTNQ